MKQKEQNNAKEYWEANSIQKAVRKLRKAKEDWIGDRYLPEQKRQKLKESMPAGKGSNLREIK